jgi:hypothetical protein
MQIRDDNFPLDLCHGRWACVPGYPAHYIAGAQEPFQFYARCHNNHYQDQGKPN